MSLKSIASAATIDLTGILAGEITGTATVSTVKGIHDGEIKWLYPAGAFSFTTGGNIAVAMTAIVGQVIFLTSRNSTVYTVNMAAIAPFDATYVTLTASGTLTNERTLAGETSVISITDGGAGSAVTVGIAANGITDAKLRQGGATSVIGRSANSTGNVADIAASADGQYLRRAAGALGFAAIAATDLPTASTTAQGAVTLAATGGPAYIVATDAKTAQGAAIGVTNLTASAVAGTYRISWFIYSTTAGNNADVYVSYKFTYNGTINTVAVNEVSGYHGGQINTISADLTSSGSAIVQADASTAIAYSTTISGALGTGRYAVYVTLERLR